MVDNTLVHFKTKENFKREKGNIQDTSIAFIKDSKQISTHDTIYNFVNWNVLDDNTEEVPQIPTMNFIDLGLPSGTLWAEHNLGATSPEDFGLYYQWGDTSGYSLEQVSNGEKVFYWYDYKYSPDGTETGINKYTGEDGLSILETSDDAATAYNSSYSIPTYEDLAEMVTNTTQTWETINGISGTRFTSNINGNSIFLPAGGLVYLGTVNALGTRGYYLTSSLDPDIRYSKVLYIRQDGAFPYNYHRSYGLTIRPITYSIS